MKFVALASLFIVAALSFAVASTPSQTEADSHTSTCETCGQTTKAECPHCAAGEACPHCDKGEACPHCGHKGHHGQDKWGKRAYEYKCVRPSKKPDAMTAQFNGLGAEGWKLKQADSGFWCFARMKQN